MNTQEKQEAIEKIKDLMDSQDLQNRKLAFKLIGGLNLTKEILGFYGLKNLTNNSLSIELESYKIEKRRTLIDMITHILENWSFSHIHKRKVLAAINSWIEITERRIDSLNEKLDIYIYFDSHYLNIKSRVIATNESIAEEILKIKEVNPLSKYDLKKLYKDIIKEGKVCYTRENPNLLWVNLKRSLFLSIKENINNPIEYELQKYNEEYSTFTVKFKIDI